MKLAQTEVRLAPDTEEEARHVTMSNRLARAAHSLDLSEKRLIALGLANTDSMPSQGLLLASTNSGWKVKVNAQEYARTFGVDPATAYSQLASAAKKLFLRYVHYETENFVGKVTRHDIRWVSSASYTEGAGYVELNFSPEIAPHLLGLSRHFTSYKLTHAAALNSVYAWRLYELLKSWQNTGTYTSTVEEFWDVMEAPPSFRKDFKELKKRVIDPATAAICAKTPMTVEWSRIKEGGRRITHIEFRFRTKPETSLPEAT